MPYKSEKIKIEGTEYDRRRKLNDEQREYIRWLHEEEKVSIHKLSEMFGVSRRLIQYILFPERLEKCRERSKIAKSQGKYKYEKEEWARIMREHRKYKQSLFKEGKI